MRMARHSNKETVFSSLKRQVWWSLKPAQRNNFAGDTIQTELVQVSSVQSLSRVRLFATPWTAALQASLSITNSRGHPNPCSSSQRYHPTISSSVFLFSSCLQSFPASGSFLKSRLFTSGGQIIGASASVLQWIFRVGLRVKKLA